MSGRQRLRLARLALIAVLPGFIKRPLYRSLFGYRIGRGVRIGLVILDAQEVELGDGTEIGHLSVVTRVGRLVTGKHVRIGPLNIVRTWAALRVMTRDGFPIYDQSAECPGAFVATCHSGVTLAANHALTLAPLIAQGALPAETFNVFSARRFHVQKAA